jgi:aminodeoxychorismate synthase component I
MLLSPVPLLDLRLSPEQVARALHDLEGFVFLDSADADQSGSSNRISIIGAQPRQVHRGSLHDPQACEVLRKSLRAHANAVFDWGFPVGGLIGQVDYDGHFVFGEYEDLLVYHHDRGKWFTIGNPDRLLDLTREIVEQRPAPPVAFTSSMNESEFVRRVGQAHEWITAGDIYQVNLARQFRASAQDTDNPYATFERLRAVSPAPYAAYLNLDNRTVLSSSPECFLRMSGRGINTRPIKGTRPRCKDPQADECSAYDLLTSQKEIAELVMITDLERNDIGRICEYGSVHVSELLKLERYAQVFHLVSTVEGRLCDEVDHVDALRVCSPGGSITGAPKKRAMEIIADLETTPRGLYTGAIGYLGWNGESQFSIAIRTLIREHDHWHFHVGSGIVADSDPVAEYQETLHKAEGILQATR